MKSISTGQLAKLFNLPKHTIRYYVDESLLIPHVNEINGYHEFLERDIYKLYQIVFLRNVGLSIETIKEVLLKDEVIPSLQDSVKNIDYQIAELTALKKTVTHILKANDEMKLGEIQFVEKESRFLKIVSDEVAQNGTIDLLKAHELGYDHLDLFFFVIDKSLEETVYVLGEKEDYHKKLNRGIYACKNIEYLNDEQLESEIELFLKDPVLEISSQSEMIIYENIYSSLSFSEKEIMTLEVLLS